MGANSNGPVSLSPKEDEATPYATGGLPLACTYQFDIHFYLLQGGDQHSFTAPECLRKSFYLILALVQGAYLALTFEMCEANSFL